MARRRPLWRWLLAGALLGGVIAAAAHFIASKDLLRLLSRVRPEWLAAAVLLQAGTYLAQGQVFRGVAGAAGKPLSVRTGYGLSLAKLFVDQTVPSAGFSGTAFAAAALRRRGLSRPARLACVAINMTTYYAAYALALGAGAVVSAHHRRGRLLGLAAAVFLALAAGVAGLFWRGLPPRRGRWLRRLPAAARLLDAVAAADRRLMSSPALLAACALWQLGVIALDATTLWTLLLSLGVAAPPNEVFAGFMVANAARSLSFVPGGLGPFEAGSVLALDKLAGVPVAAALSATLLFRLLSFWLPLIPGLFAMRAYRPRALRKVVG